MLITGVLTWAKDLNSAARRIRQLEEQSKIVAFWENWMRTVGFPTNFEQPVGSKINQKMNMIVHQARFHLAEAGNAVLTLYRKDELREIEEFRLSFEEFQHYRSGLAWYRRFFLLYKAPNESAKLYKISFYVNLMIPLIVASIEIPIIWHLRRVEERILLSVPAIDSARQFLHLHPAVHVSSLVVILSIVLLIWVSSVNRPRSRSRAAENNPNLYVLQSNDEEYMD